MANSTEQRKSDNKKKKRVAFWEEKCEKNRHGELPQIGTTIFHFESFLCSLLIRGERGTLNFDLKSDHLSFF